MPDPATPGLDYKKEIRFAVVMYGGVSLAIYINGVAQELLRMVKATAPSAEDENVARNLEECGKKGTEAVYRKLSYLMDDPANRDAFRKALAVDWKAAHTWEPQGNIRVRFMVDVLAGTSAGGINSIYLAKALANDQKIDKLKNLWVTEGDIHSLINDRQSLKDTSLSRQRPPHSLLNSQRMYLRLLEALDGMDDEEEAQYPPKKRSPLVDELDLFITATDIRGLALPIRLAESVVWERRHKNVFRFKYMIPSATGSDANEFRRELNPFLAFAARTTSSFPFAFEPVRLADIRDLLDHSEEHRRHKDDFKPDSELIKRFFQENLTHEVEFGSVEYDTRSFADGGYLDNKPFSYATSTLMRRTPNVPVDRKLIYVEPSPEHPERDVQPKDPPDAIQNVLAALDLPRYETIREDIQLVLERNRLIDRVNRLTRFIERDIETYEGRQEDAEQSRKRTATDPKQQEAIEQKAELELLSTSVKAALKDDPKAQDELANQMRAVRPDIPRTVWDSMQMSDMAGLYGIYYLPYRRLRIAKLTDDIAALTARIAGFDEESDMFIAIRALVNQWRDTAYSDDQPKDGNTLNRFLNTFDLDYRMRRLNFLVAKIDELLSVIDYLIRLRNQENVRLNNPDSAETSKTEESISSIRFILRVEKHRPVDFDFRKSVFENPEQAIQVLLYLKCELNQLFIKLRKFGRNLARAGNIESTERSPAVGAARTDEQAKPTPTIEDYREKVRHLGIDIDDLKLILGESVKDKQPLKIKDPLAVECFHSDDVMARAEDFWNNAAKYEVPDLQSNFEAAAKDLRSVLGSVLQPTRELSEALLNAQYAPTPSNSQPEKTSCQEKPGAKYLDTPFGLTVRAYLWDYFKHFDDYDQISFPIFFETDVGEADVVEVIRVSPEDAPSLINEKTDARRRKKLAGTRLGNFSAFLDASWRVNDIMWGRLDGAERLIKSLLPNDNDRDIRDALTREAHQIILAEELSPAAQADLARLLGEAVVKRKGGLSVSEAIEKVLKPVDDEVVKQRLSSVMTNCFRDDELYTFIRDHYEVDRRFEPEPTLKVLGRATRVIGDILDDISRKRNVESKFTQWISRIGQIFLGLVEVAVPDSMMSLLFRHWLKLLYAFEVLLLVLATFVLSTPGVANFAWKLLALTLTANFAVLVLRDFMQAKRGWMKAGMVLLTAILLFFAAVGFDSLLNLGVRSRMSATLNRITRGRLGTAEPAPTPFPVLVTFPPSPAPESTPGPSPLPTSRVTPSSTQTPSPHPTANQLPPSTPTPPLGTAALIREAEKTLVPGTWAFNVPDQMVQGMSERISARISQQDLAVIGPFIANQLRGNGVPQVESLKTSKLMKVTLSSTFREAFDVTIQGNETKEIRDNPPYTDWEWDVVPRESGNQELHLKVTAILLLPGGGQESYEIPVKDKPVLVRVSYKYIVSKFVSNNPAWVIGAIPAIVGAIIGFINRRKILQKIFHRRSGALTRVD
ncbi:MAG TPA: patatin-like protein [Pyrinomonadaceae bacterium]|jgi:predicted acylesterase/phospholipase RssA|nr:patatin-like protein [Pyrinomonadaceae bacterium]